MNTAAAGQPLHFDPVLSSVKWQLISLVKNIDAFLLLQVTYYCQRSLYNTAYKQCEVALRRRTSDPVLVFWRAFALIMQGRTGEALRDLEPLQEKRELVLACPAAMIYAHERCKIVDREAVQELQAKLTIAASTASSSDRASMHMALFLWQTGEYDQARDYLRKIMDNFSSASGKPASTNAAPSSVAVYWMAVTFMGWVDLTCGQDALVAKSSTWFDKVLDEYNPKDLDALMGRLQSLRATRQKLAVALDINSQIITYHTTFIPAYIERMYVLVEMGSWDLIVEAVQRVSNLSPDCVDTYAVFCLNELCHEGRLKQAATHLANLNLAIAKTEPLNAGLYYLMAQTFCRLAGRRDIILEQTASLIAKAIELEPSNMAFKCEMGFIYFLMGKLEKAMELYRVAVAQNSQDITAIHGLIKCQIFKGNFDDAEEQIEFLEAMQSTNTSAETAYLCSLVAKYKYRNSEKQSRYLRQASELTRKHLSNKAIGLSYYVRTNPDFLMELAQDFLESCPAREPLHPFLSSTSDVLQQVIKIAPGNVEALNLVGCVKFLMGDLVTAQSMANACLKIDAAHAKAHILTAQVHLANKNAKGCLSALDIGLSMNFEVRHILTYHVLKAKALKMQGNNEEAIKILSGALGMSIMRDSAEDSDVPKIKRSDAVPSTSEKISVYLELAEAYSKLKNAKEAAEIMDEASRIFGHTSESHRIILTNANLCLERGEIDSALSILSGISQNHQSFVKAKTQMGSIYLNFKKDRKAYARCYNDLYERCKSVETCILLGEAYMNIQEPEKAIEVYENGIDVFDDPFVLACKIGNALIKTHDYARAISYYESALGKNTPNSASLRYDLAELYFKLRNYEDVERIVSDALNHPRTEEAMVLHLDVKFNILQGKSYRAMGRYDNAISSLSTAKELQLRIIAAEIVSSEIANLKRLVADICCEIGDVFAINMNDSAQAIMHYTEATQVFPKHEKAKAALSRLSIAKNDLTTAQTHCMSLLRDDPDNYAATLLMAEIQFLNNDYQTALAHYRSILEPSVTSAIATTRMSTSLYPSGTAGTGAVETAAANGVVDMPVEARPSDIGSSIAESRKMAVTVSQSYRALRSAIEMLRRAGKMEDAIGLFELCEKNSTRRSSNEKLFASRAAAASDSGDIAVASDPAVFMHAGYHFCKGLYHRYTNSPNEALKAFNCGRKDAEWGTECLYNMIEIFLNPDNETLGGEVLESAADGNGSTDQTDADILALLTADKLLKELPQNPKSLRTQVLECHAWMVTKQKSEIERALAHFTQILQEEADYVPSLLGIAIAYMLLKQPPRARNQLKRIVKMDWSIEHAEDFERAWLLLADIYIQGGKYDLATDLLKRCLGQNKSCSKAYEYLGYIMEKEASYKDAAEAYSNAWKLERESNATIGFKLAFNHLKAKKYVEAVEISHKVLKLYPDYPKIRKEILDKARTLLRS
ncbi:Tetratricopeptide repeat protein 21B [Entophlyctis sp. JEL0112]|nr:Tetratricopeptide repeat protein 21B [Entophlyctis sp. JEL0112]